MTTVLVLGSFFKGERALRAFKELGCRTVLVGTASVLHKPWSPELVDEKFFVPDFEDEQALLHAISYLAQERNIDLVFALEEYSIGKAAKVAAHLGCPGISEGLARRVRDKLTMRSEAERAGIPVPSFAPFFNRSRLASFLHEVPGPWLVKPRSAGGSVQIRKLHEPPQVWELFETLGDQRSFHLIERFIPGQVYHVDSVVCEGRVLASACGRYGTPPFNVWHGGGVFTSVSYPEMPFTEALSELNARVLSVLGVRTSVTHVEFIVSGGRPYFLEIGARVPGSNLDQLATGVTGLDLYREAVMLELHRAGLQEYRLPALGVPNAAALLITLAQCEKPDLSFCREVPEVRWCLAEDHHAGVLVADPDPARVERLYSELEKGFRERLVAVLPPSEQPA